MAGQPITFPASTQPSINPTENGGRLINAFAEKAPDGSRSQVIIRSAPGLTRENTVGAGAWRGALVVAGVLYIANGDKVYSVTSIGGAPTTLSGTLPGTGRVMMERNMNATPQILIWHSEGLSQISGTTVSDFSDPDLPSVNSLSWGDSYFFFTTGDGQAFASGINDVTVSALDVTKAEASPDGLVRGVFFGRNQLLMGTSTIEFWSDTAQPTGYPFSRGPVLSLGLLSTFAVAGMEPGFTSDLCFVGSDRRVYRFSGYTPAPISTPYHEALLQALDDVTELDASVYSVAGHSCFVLSTESWTLVYDLTTGGNECHERQSYGSTRWQAQGGIFAFDRWLTFEKGGSGVYSIDPTNRREDTAPLVWEVRSTQAHRFPGRFVVNRASFDMVTGVGIDRGISPIETDPAVNIAWSDDGGKTWGNPLIRRLGKQGVTTPIDIQRAGLTSRLGRQWRLWVSDPVPVSLMGAAMDVEARAA